MRSNNPTEELISRMASKPDGTAGNGYATSTSVERAFDLLDRIAAAGAEGITLGQLAGEVRTAKSTTHRYVATLIELGAVRRDQLGRLHLGLKLIELAGALLGSDDLRSVADPILKELVRSTGETVHLGLPSEGDVVYIAKVESPQSVRLVSRIGARVPMYCSAMGKALMATLDDDALERLLASPREARTAHTIVGDAELRAELARVRERGFAIDDEENEAGVRCVGVSIVDAHGDALGAISVSAPAGRMTLARARQTAPSVVAAGHEIARRLGHGSAAGKPTEMR
jgi:DNA-binding IclR family transcriptional regulator